MQDDLGGREQRRKERQTLIVAFVLKLLLQPALRLIERRRVPRMLGALLLISLLFGTVVGLGAVLSGPAASWAAKLTHELHRSFALDQHVEDLALLVDDSPVVHPLAVDPDDRLVEMPLRACAWTAVAQPARKHRPEPEEAGRESLQANGVILGNY